MEQISWTGLFGIFLVALIMANGFAMILGGPKAVGKLNRWILKQIRNLVGGIFIWFGRQIKSPASSKKSRP
ncbi:hypothetical protein HYW58_00320 [Candidatus Kaiserbacteria bacterium]|nr:hypothetical protein [Candidatus Kaiserbacteria bacterium]